MKSALTPFFIHPRIHIPFPSLCITFPSPPCPALHLPYSSPCPVSPFLFSSLSCLPLPFPISVSPLPLNCFLLLFPSPIFLSLPFFNSLCFFYTLSFSSLLPTYPSPFSLFFFLAGTQVCVSAATLPWTLVL